MAKLKSLGDLMANAHDDSEAFGYIVISLAAYGSFGKGMSPEQLAELVDDISRYLATKQERREKARA